MTDPVATQRHELRQAIYDCRERRLNEAARWASLQIAGMHPDPECHAPSSASRSHGTTTTFEEEDAYDLALGHFDFREYASAAHALHKLIHLPNTSLKTHFLYYYSLYLKNEKERAEKPPPSSSSLPSTSSSDTPHNEALQTIQRGIESLGDNTDGFLLYLLGLVLIDKHEKEAARHALTLSVTAYPCNYSAWKALQSACPDIESSKTLSLPQHFMRLFFESSLKLDFQQSSEALEVLRLLADQFPQSDALIHNAALAHYNMHNYDYAQKLLEELLETDPHRLEGMDTYSNILYVKEDTPSLALLARRCSEQDPYRSESCCIAGNYYSLRGQHEKAVVYFRRALKLNPAYIAAWTLMGHEYVELRNPSAAIDAYQRAIALNPKDYRAWYGLGQTYELVNMPYYALHYYRKAVALRPHDARMWNAMAHCYASPALGQTEHAIRCYRRALAFDKEGVSVHQLAILHAALGQRKDAAHYYTMNLQRTEAEGLSMQQDAVEALGYLAQYYKETGNYDLSQQYYTRLLDYGVPQQRELAKMSLRVIQEAKMAAAAVAATPGGMSTPGSMDMGITPPR